MQCRRTRETLTWHGLDDVALDDVLAQPGDVRFIALLANIRHRLSPLRPRRYRWLLGQRHRRSRRDRRRNPPDPLRRRRVQPLDLRPRDLAVRHVDMRQHLHALIEVIERDDRVAEHVQALGDAERIGQRRLLALDEVGLKVPDAVVCEVADRAASEGRHAGDGHVAEARELGLEVLERVALQLPVRPGAQNAIRICVRVSSSCAYRQARRAGRSAKQRNAPDPTNE